MKTASRVTLSALLWLTGMGVAQGATDVWTPIGPEGGIVRSLVIDPSAPARLYAATPGGVFRSTDGGATWSASNPEFDAHSLAIDPGGRLFGGTLGAGVISSTDSGASWFPLSGAFIMADVIVAAFAIDPVTSTTRYTGTRGAGVFMHLPGFSWFPAGIGLTNLDVRSLVIDPASPTTLYVGTGGGVFKSTDQTASWSAANNGLTSLGILSLAIDPVTPTTLYAGTDGGGVFKSTDGGASWSAVNGGVPSGISVSALAIDPTTPATVYAGTNGGGVFKSTDAGASWSPASTGLTNGSMLTLAIDPVTPTTLYGGTKGGGVFKSTNGGAGWSAANTGLTATVAQALAVDPLNPAKLYAGTSAGVFRTTDAGATWNASFDALDRFGSGVPIGPVDVPSLAIDPGASSTLFGGTLGAGVIKSDDAGASWVVLFGASVLMMDVAVTALTIDPVSPTTRYAGTVGSGVFKHRPFVSWFPASTGLTNLDVRSLAIDPTSTATVYAGTFGGGVFKSTDGAGSWTAVNSGLTNLSILSLAIDPVTPTTLYAGTEAGGVFKSTNGGASWSNTGLPTGASVTSLAIDPVIPVSLYAGTYGNGVFKTTDGGASWGALNDGLTNPFIRALAIAPGGASVTVAAGSPNPVVVFAGTDGGGVFAVQSLDPVNTCPRSASGVVLCVSPLTGPPGTEFTVTLGDWSGGMFDWLAIAPVGSPDTTYGQWAYVSRLPAGSDGTRTWKVTLSALGTFEVRLLLNNGFAVALRSVPFTVASGPALNPTPAITTLSPPNVVAGSAGFELTVNGSGFVNGATATVGGQPRDVTFESSTRVRIAVQTADIVQVGNVPVVVTNPGPCVATGCVSNTAQLVVTTDVTPPPSPLSVSPSSGPVGTEFTVTLCGWNGGAFDWLAIAPAGSPDTTYGPWVYVSRLTEVDGNGCLVWRATVNAPGTYEARLLLNNGFTVVLRSAPFTVGSGGAVPGPGPVPGPLTLNVSPLSGPPGAQFAVTLCGWNGGQFDWLAIAPVGSPDTTYGSWIYVPKVTEFDSNGCRVWRVTMNTPGAFEARLLPNNGFTVALRSAPFTVGGAP